MSPVSPIGDSPRVPSPVAEAGASVAPAAVVRRGRDGRRMNPRSLDNLVPGAGAWKPGDAPHLLHGARGRAAWNPPGWAPCLALAAAEMERCVGVEVMDGAGVLESWARPSVEAVAQQLVNMR